MRTNLLCLKNHLKLETSSFYSQNLRKKLQKAIKNKGFYLIIKQFIDYLINNEHSSLDIYFHKQKAETLLLIGPLIKNITNNKKLKINYDNSNIGDDGSKFIKSLIMNLNNLRELYLNLSLNKIGSLGVSYISSSITNLNKLVILKLDFNDNKIGESGLESLSNPIKLLKNLNILELNLRENFILNSSLKHFSSCLNELHDNLIYLKIDFSLNYIHADGFISLALVINDFCKLTTLILLLEENKISHEGTDILSKSISSLKLKRLEINLKDNKIGKNGIKLLEILKTQSQIEVVKIDLSFNNIGFHKDSITDNCCFLSYLKIFYLNVEKNNLSQYFVKFLMNILLKVNKLTNLKLIMKDNKLGDEGVSILAESFSQIPNLIDVEIDLSCNKLGDIGFEHMFGKLVMLQYLEKMCLYFGYNRVSNKAMDYLSKLISNFSKLKEIRLCLHNNSIGSEGAYNLCTKLNSNMFFTQLCLSGNVISFDIMFKFQHMIFEI